MPIVRIDNPQVYVGMKFESAKADKSACSVVY
jgi:hypothetical protein